MSKTVEQRKQYCPHQGGYGYARFLIRATILAAFSTRRPVNGKCRSCRVGLTWTRLITSWLQRPCGLLEESAVRIDKAERDRKRMEEVRRDRSEWWVLLGVKVLAPRVIVTSNLLINVFSRSSSPLTAIESLSGPFPGLINCFPFRQVAAHQVQPPVTSPLYIPVRGSGP